MAPTPNPDDYDFEEMIMPDLEAHLKKWREHSDYKSAMAKQKASGTDPKFTEMERAVTRMVVDVKATIKEKQPKTGSAEGAELKQMVAKLTEQNTALHDSMKVVQKRAMRPEREKIPGHDQDWVSRKSKTPKVETACKKVYTNADANHENFFDMKTDVVEPLLEQLKVDRERAAPEIPKAVAEEQEELLQKAKEACEKGMAFNHELAEVAMIAFEEGWEVAAAFQKQEVIKDDDRKVRLEKVKKEVRKEKDRKSLSERKDARKTSGWDKKGKQCYLCKAWGHIATNCPQRETQTAQATGRGTGTQGVRR